MKKLWLTALAAGSVVATRKALSALRDLDADDFLGRVGLERRRSTFDMVLPAVGCFLGGAAIGAGIALLATPMSGGEMRGEISRRARDMKGRAAEKINELEERLQRSPSNATGTSHTHERG